MTMNFMLQVAMLAALATFSDGETCADKEKEQNCKAWKDRGFCAATSQFRQFMEGSCKKSCDFCKGYCLNNEAYSSNCPTWKGFGYCSKDSTHYGFMKQHCSLECGVCTVQKLSGGSTCADSGRYSTCGVWKNAGYCKETSSYHGFMKDHCKKTCNLCEEACKDLGDAAYCSKYKPYCKHATVGEIISYNCRKTCGVCSDTAVCGIGKDTSGRVIGGENAEKTSWPWQAVIKINGKGICGGTLIAKNWVLTAAHCMIKNGRRITENELEVVLGEHDKSKVEGTEQSFRVLRIVRHPDHNPTTKDSDITLLELNQGATLNKYVGLACLPTEEPKLKLESTCFITGFGKTKGLESPGAVILQEARLPVVSNQECSILNRYPKVTKNMLCAGHGLDFSKIQSGCQGDSGGPFVCTKNGVWSVQGVVSWGSSSCISGEMNTVFARVLNYVDWIKKTIR